MQKEILKAKARARKTGLYKKKLYITKNLSVFNSNLFLLKLFQEKLDRTFAALLALFGQKSI